MNIGGTMVDDIRVAIGYPSGENISSQFALHMMSLLMYTKLPISTIATSCSSRVAFNRNAIVEIAKAANSTHLLFVDADMIFPNLGLETLFSHNLDIVGATACKRDDTQPEPIGWALDGTPLIVPSTLTKMKLMGICFMLIKMSVFDKLKKPYFCEPSMAMMGRENDEALMPEDEYFCNQAISNGYDIWCDTVLSASIGHRGAKTFRIQPKASQLVALDPNLKMMKNVSFA